MHRQHQHGWEAGWESRLSGPTPYLLDQVVPLCLKVQEALTHGFADMDAYWNRLGSVHDLQMLGSCCRLEVTVIDG